MTTFLKNMLIFQHRDHVVLQMKIDIHGNTIFIYSINK